MDYASRAAREADLRRPGVTPGAATARLMSRRAAVVPGQWTAELARGATAVTAFAGAWIRDHRAAA